jgi:hypothetical protein
MPFHEVAGKSVNGGNQYAQAMRRDTAADYADKRCSGESDLVILSIQKIF